MLQITPSCKNKNNNSDHLLRICWVKLCVKSYRLNTQPNYEVDSMISTIK